MKTKNLSDKYICSLLEDEAVVGTTTSDVATAPGIPGFGKKKKDKKQYKENYIMEILTENDNYRIYEATDKSIVFEFRLKEDWDFFFHNHKRGGDLRNLRTNPTMNAYVESAQANKHTVFKIQYENNFVHQKRFGYEEVF